MLLRSRLECEEVLRLSVCLFVRLRISITYVQTSRFFVGLHVSCREILLSGSVHVWRQCNMLCTSGFDDSVMFSYNRAYIWCTCGEAYSRGMLVSGRQRKEGWRWSAEASLLSALPPADWHPLALSLAVNNVLYAREQCLLSSIALLRVLEWQVLGRPTRTYSCQKKQELIRRRDSERELLRSAPGSDPNSLK